jgi:uncharacterized membrane protein (UPF0127 family)
MASRLSWLLALNFIIFAVPAFSNPNVKTTRPQFDQIKIELSFEKRKKILEVELAKTPHQHAYGLMYRNSLPKDTGMLFVFENEQTLNFWMKNTLIDLDIAYFDKTKTIVDIQTMKAVVSVLQTQIPSYPSKKPAQFALEMNSGWFKKNGFKLGTKMKYLTGPKSN